MEKIRLEFEDWHSQQKRDHISVWHPAETLEYDRKKYPNGRYTIHSQKQSDWEVWQAAWAVAQSAINNDQNQKDSTCETVELDDGKKVKVCYTVIPLTPHNSSRNHISVDIDSESEAKESGIKYIPEEDGEYWTAEQILEYMIKNLRGEDIVEILKCQKESEMIAFHSSVGRWIRNTFKLWDTKNPHLDGMHPDEMSTEILKGIWRTVVRREYLGM